MLRNRYLKHVRPIKIVIPLVHYGGIGKNGHSVISRPVSLVYVAEETQAGTNRADPAEQLPGAVEDTSVPVEDAVRRRMGDKNIRVIRNGGVELLLNSVHAVLHKHRHTPELQPIYLHPASAEVMDVIVKSVQMSSVKAGVVVARD